MIIFHMDRLWFILLFVWFAQRTTGVNAEEGCTSPQYLEIGRQGQIVCLFQEGFSIVYWYDSQNYVTDLAIVKYTEDTGKRGDGITSGEYDIFPNGSLIIKNVSLQHDHYFTAVKLNSLEDDFVPHYVRVVATVKPLRPHPVIDQCGYERTTCFAELGHGSELNCSIQDSRPGVPLEWMVVTANGDKNVTFKLITTSNSTLNTTTVQTADPFTYSPVLSLLVCKANYLPWILDHTESFILVQSKGKGLSTSDAISKQAKMNSRVELKCADKELSFLVWKHTHNEDEKFNPLLYAAFVKDNFTISEIQGYDLGDGGSLVIPDVKVKNEGFYGCIYGNGTNDGTIVYVITVFVPPSPSYPVVDGCNHGQYCVLDVHRQGTLTCTVRAIRPKIKLIWQTFHESSSVEIFFSNQETTVTNNKDDTFDVSLTAQYDAKHSRNNKVTIECKVPDAQKERPVFRLSTKLDLLFVKVNEPTPDYVAVSDDPGTQPKNITWIIILVILITLLISLGLSILFIRAKLLKAKSLQNKLSKEEVIPFVQVSEDKYKEMKEELVTYLKAKYADLCAAVYPVPFLRKKLYSIDKVFVEGGYQCLLSGDKWIELESYSEIFSNPLLNSKRRIIEGEAGYGKSTLALQLAYDWYNGVEGTYMKNKDIFILLRLRQLKGVGSIFKAIRKCLFPTDAKLSEVDIENVLQEYSKSVIIVLDGYDEYPDQEKGTKSFVINIMKKDIMQQFEVILTTRSSCLPDEYASLTKRIKLTGFDEDAREVYLQRVFGVEDNKTVENIKERMKENSFLEDLFQVPLFFVLYAHITNVKKEVTQFNSVTVFFRYIVSCLHNHRKNKLENLAEKKKFEYYESEHSQLDKIAFEGLSGKCQQLVWEKDIIVKELGEEFYNQYIAIGVLVEEEICHISDAPGTFTSEHVQYREEVRFYHKLFCEWYAAHYLAYYASKPEVKFDLRGDEGEDSESAKDSKINELCAAPKNDFLKNLDPAELQYVYRFACGLNLIAADKIFQYLKTICGGERFALLCILEQTGKFDVTKKDIQQLCASTLSMYGNHSNLLQRSTIQLLEIASRQEITISQVWLCNCFQSVGEDWKHLILKSGFKFPKLQTLRALDIRESEKVMTEKETAGILKYCSGCAELRTLKFMYSLQPWSVPINSLDVLQQRKVKVIWDTDFNSFSLNLTSGLWHTEDRPMTKEEYQEQVEQFHRLQKNNDADDNTRENKV